MKQHSKAGRRRTWRGLALLAVLAALPAAASPPPPGPLVFIGTRLKVPQNSIYVARFDETGGTLTALGTHSGIVMPTWLLASARIPVLYAVSETGNNGGESGHVYSLAVAADGTLTPISVVSSGGGGATYLAIDRQAKTLLVADYGTGQVAALPLLGHGALGAPVAVVSDHGSGPSPRQKGPHAHGTTPDPSGAYVLVPDLGADHIFIYHVNRATGALAPDPAASVALPPGTGPRHVVFSPDGKNVYLISELSAQLFSFQWNSDAAALQLVQTQSLVPDGFAGKKSGGDLTISPDGLYLYASVRGDANELVVYARDSQTGALHEIQRLPSGGVSPWYITLDPSGRWLLAANEGSGSITSFSRAPDTGLLQAVPGALSVPHASSIAFIKEP